jgi:NADPH-dependent glutamate synthase beta subunit-like oxidoreductase/coenzyme F420-reducing hydrogenase delta subunit/Pyruvate/2-oxoacid:ferredoxin oxidoreductase delta subunit
MVGPHSSGGSVTSGAPMTTKKSGGGGASGRLESRLSGPSGEFALRSEGHPTCSEACPAGIDVKAYVNLVADRRYEDALQVILRANPFPGVCGRVCTHPCEEECLRGEVDDPVAIKALKRFASDYARSRRACFADVRRPKKGQHVAVIGAGPAGLTAAADIARAGYGVTVFEAGKEAGGILSWGIPEFRLPKSIVRAEVRDIASLGVDIQTGQRVERPLGLLKRGFAAVILAQGCQAPLELKIEGEGSAGVIDCLDFLKAVSDGTRKALPGRCVVIGGGNAALDAARTAVRLGAKVTLAYRRTAEEMPADPEEVAQAREEGVQFEFLLIPKGIFAAGGKVKYAEFQRARLGEPDASGRRSPVPIPGSFAELGADWVIRAVGSRPESGDLEDAGVRLTARGTVAADDYGATSVKGIFAAGDLVLGPATIVEAIGGGHAAAEGVLAYLEDRKPIPSRSPVPEMLVMERAPEKSPRTAQRMASPEARAQGFDEVELGLDEYSAIAEASRCRRCGVCSDCDLCLSACEHRQAVLVTDDGDRWVKVPLDVSKRLAEEPQSRRGWTLSVGGRKTKARFEPLQATVDPEACIACGLCDEACAYRAIRVRFAKGGEPVAVVDPIGCRGCGACASVCPTGAISQGYMDDGPLFDTVHSAAKESKGGVVRFECLWHSPDKGLARAKASVNVICTRRASPGLVLEALVSGASGVALAGCAAKGCHYLPGPWTGEEVAARTAKALAAVGVDPRRVTYVDGSDLAALTAFAAELGKAKLGPMMDVHTKLPANRSVAGRGVWALHALMAQPDGKGSASKKGKYALAPGCAPVVGAVLVAHGLRGAEQMAHSARELMARKGLRLAEVPGLYGPGCRLERWGLGELYEAYAKRVIRGAGNAGVKCLVTISQEAQAKFADEWTRDFGKLGFEVVPLPELLRERLKKPDFADDGPVTVAVAPDCSGFAGDVRALLALAPGVRVVEAAGDCGEPFWSSPGAKAAAAARALLSAADAKGADVLVVDEPQCLAQLNAVQAGWRDHRVEVADIYTFLLSRMKGARSDG